MGRYGVFGTAAPRHREDVMDVDVFLEPIVKRQRAAGAPVGRPAFHLQGIETLVGRAVAGAQGQQASRIEAGFSNQRRLCAAPYPSCYLGEVEGVLRFHGATVRLPEDAGPEPALQLLSGIGWLQGGAQFHEQRGQRDQLRGVRHVVAAEYELGVEEFGGAHEPRLHSVCPAVVVGDVQVQDVVLAAADRWSAVLGLPGRDGFPAAFLRSQQGDGLQKLVAADPPQHAIGAMHAVTAHIPIVPQGEFLVLGGKRCGYQFEHGQGDAAGVDLLEDRADRPPSGFPYPD